MWWRPTFMHAVLIGKRSSMYACKYRVSTYVCIYIYVCIYWCVCNSMCICMYVDLKFTQNRPWRPRRGVEIWLYSFFHLGARWGGWSTPHPDHFTPGKRHGTHCTEGWVGPRAGLDGWGNLAPTEIRPRTIQPVASRYIDYALPAHICM